jgi:hypothetical protein
MAPVGIMSRLKSLYSKQQGMTTENNPYVKASVSANNPPPDEPALSEKTVAIFSVCKPHLETINKRSEKKDKKQKQRRQKKKH